MPLRRAKRRDPSPAKGTATDAAVPESQDLEGIDAADRAIIERSFPFTMTGAARLAALVDAVRYCTREEVAGDFVECGVWRGGSVLAMALTLRELAVEDREIYLYDTFTGMTEPTDSDVSRDGSALGDWRAAEASGERAWGEMFHPTIVNEDAVRSTVIESGYPAERFRFVPGPVEDTIPKTIPGRIALLRLDTDWYESTRHELEHLYPLLAPGGVLIIDDYGHWEGARAAVDEYFESHPPRPLLTRIDYTGRIAVKPGLASGETHLPG